MDFKSYAEQLKELRDEEQIKWLDGIVKFLPSGDEGVYYNKNFFTSWIWDVNEDYINWMLANYNSKLNDLREYKKTLKKDEDIAEAQKIFLLKIVNSTILNIWLLKSAILLDAEKSGYKLDEKEKELHHKRVLKLQDYIYWPKISDVEEEKDLVLQELKKLYLKNSSRLSEDEKEEYESFLQSFWIDTSSEIDNGETSLKVKKEEKKLSNEWERQNVPKLEDYYLQWDKAKILFEMVLDLYGLELWSIDLWPYNNMSVVTQERSIKIPEWKISSYDLFRILKLIDHEASRHVTVRDNMLNGVGIPWFWFVFWDEWYAKIAEALFDKKLEDINIVPAIGHFSTFISENFAWDEAERLLRIYYKMALKEWTSQEAINKEAKWRALRTKWFVARNKKWAARKDVSYYRGTKMTLEYLKSLDQDEEKWKNFTRDFFYSKVSLEDIDLVPELREAFKDVKEENFVYPIWVWKILYKKLLWDKIFLEKLKEEDPRFLAIDRLSLETKKHIIKILNFVDENKTLKKKD